VARDKHSANYNHQDETVVFEVHFSHVDTYSASFESEANDIIGYFEFGVLLLR
jgi:hypothetical protein